MNKPAALLLLCFWSLNAGTGCLQIVSDSLRPAVFLDGIARGKAPLLISLVSPGEHRVECRLDGYIPFQKTVSVSLGDTLVVLCTPEPGTVLDVFTSFNDSVRRMELFLDGKRSGRTPYRELISRGRHALRLTRSDFEDIDINFDTEQKQELKLSLSMKRSQAYLKEMERLREEMKAESKWWKEELRLKMEEREREKALQRKHFIKKTQLVVRKASCFASAVFGVASVYHYFKTRSKIKDYQDVQAEYDNATERFSGYESRYNDKKEEAESSAKTSYVFMGLTTGMGAVFGITFTF